MKTPRFRLLKRIPWASTPHRDRPSPPRSVNAPAPAFAPDETPPPVDRRLIHVWGEAPNPSDRALRCAAVMAVVLLLALALRLLTK